MFDKTVNKISLLSTYKAKSFLAYTYDNKLILAYIQGEKQAKVVRKLS